MTNDACGEEALLSARRDPDDNTVAPSQSKPESRQQDAEEEVENEQARPLDRDSSRAAAGTRYPIAWYGEKGWEQELQNKGGSEAVGVMLVGDGKEGSQQKEEEDDDDKEGKAFADRVEAARTEDHSRRGGGRARLHRKSGWSRTFLKIIRHEPLLYIAALVLVLLTLFCAVLEVFPAGVVSFVMSGGLFSRPIIRAAPRYPALRDILVKSDEFKRLWDRAWSSTAGEVLLHVFLGIVTVWILAAVHANRARALLTLAVTSLSAAVAMGRLLRDRRATRVIRDGVNRFKNALSSIPGLRALNSIVPSGESAAKVITQLSTVLTAFLVPLALYFALARFFPLTTRWITDDLSKGTVIKLLLVPVMLAYVFFNARRALAVEQEQERRQPRSSFGGDTMTPSLATAWAVVLCAFVILRYLSPVNAREDTRHVFEMYSLEGVLPNFKTKSNENAPST